jgi:hypothetical protein
VSIRDLRRVASVVSLGLCTVVGGTVMAMPASAAGTTILHFYSVSQTATLTDPAGKPITDPNAQAMVGDHIDTTGLEYVGNKKHHASSYSGSAHLACVVTSASTATCSAQIAIGGALLLANNVTLNSTQNGSSPVPINGGTGKYKNARGTLTSNNNDVTIRLTG